MAKSFFFCSRAKRTIHFKFFSSVPRHTRVQARISKTNTVMPMLQPSPFPLIHIPDHVRGYKKSLTVPRNKPKQSFPRLSPISFPSPSNPLLSEIC